MAESVSPGLGLTITITSDVAADIGSLLYHAMKRAGRENAETFTADSWRIAQNITELAKAHRAGSCVVTFPVASATGSAALPAIVDSMVEEISVSAWAKKTGRRPSSIRRSCKRETLAARKVDGDWLICTENIGEAS